MRILVTGGSSFVGAHFCRVAAREHDVHALVYSSRLQLNGVTTHKVDLRRHRDLVRLRALDADAVVHLACRIQARPMPGQTPAEAAAQVNREMMTNVLALGLPTVYASSTVVHWTTPTPYGDSRREDEARLKESGLPFAILRPSAPYGPPLFGHIPRHKESFHTLGKLVKRAPFVPVIGSGNQRRQPIHVGDFARFGLALLDKGLDGQTYEAGGGSAHTLRDIIDIMGQEVGRRSRVVPLPKALFVQAARLLPDFDPDLMAAADEDEVADPSRLVSATGLQPLRFEDGVGEMMARL